MTQPTVGFGEASPTPCRAKPSAWVIQCSSACSAEAVEGLSTEQGLHKRIAVEGQQVVDLLAYPDVADRQPELASYGDGNAALGRSVEFGEDDASDPGGLGK